jgi:copper chaperone CopZ
MDQQKTLILDVSGMTCSGCAAAVVRVISRLDGDAKTQVDLAAGHVTTQTSAQMDVVVKAISAAGYEARPA